MGEKRRHVAKSITWRIMATTITFLICFFVVGKIEYVMSIAILDTILKLTLYYFHERLWSTVGFGRVKINKRGGRCVRY